MAQHDEQDQRIGDKVRVLREPAPGEKGTLVAVDGDQARVQLSTGVILSVPWAHLQNTSLAARRAWRTRPKRAGRPPGTSTSRKRMVSLRIDADVWERLGQAVEQGLLGSREEVVNRLLAALASTLNVDDRDQRRGE